MVECFFKGRHIKVIEVSICNQNISGCGKILEQILGNIRAPKVVVYGNRFLVSQNGHKCGRHFEA